MESLSKFNGQRVRCPPLSVLACSGVMLAMPLAARAATAASADILRAYSLTGVFCGVLALVAAGIAVLWIRSASALSKMRGRLEEAELMREVLKGASALVWSANVSRSADGRLAWNVSVSPESRESPVLGVANRSGVGGLWSAESSPDLEQMTRVATEAIESGAQGYRHEFRLYGDHELNWYHEETVIHRRGPSSWKLFGVITDVAEYHRIEEAARKSAAQVKSILERADCLIWHASVAMEAGVWNWDFEIPSSGLQKRLFGETDVVKTRRIYLDFHVPSREKNDRRSQSAMLSGASGYEQEFEMVRKRDGQVFWIQEQVSIVSDGPSRWKLAGVMIDVSSRHLADDARQEKEEQLNRILMGIECMLWLANVTREESGAFTWRFVIPDSLLYRKLFGGDPGSKGNVLWFGHNVPDIESLNERSSAAFLTGQPGYEQEFCFFSSGGVHWLHEQVAVKPMGANSWQAVGLVTDITDRRSAERELAAEKERLAVTLRAMEEGVVTLGLDGTVQYINRAAERLFSVTSYEAHARPITDLCHLVDLASGAELEWPVRPVLRDGEAADLPTGAAVRAEQGRPVEIEGCVVPLRDPQSIVLGAVIVLRDVTDRRRLEAQLQRASKLESVGLLAGGIAHDFNNILTAVIGNIGLARMEIRPGSPEETYLLEVQHATERARGLTQQLLTFAKGGEPVRSAVELPDVIAEVAGFAVRGSPVKCEFDLPEGLWAANADRGQLAQIIQNLVINAVQAMPGGGTVTISAANEEVSNGTLLPLSPGNYVRIVIEDTGSGIPAENLARIFEPYFTTKPKGSGLGLATAYSIVRRHRGSIDAESGLGRGAKFILRLPALPGEKPRVGAVVTAPVRTLKGRVLVMDDEEPIRKLLETLLRRIGLDVTVCATGQDAVARYREAWSQGCAHDVLIMDLTVPGNMGGAQTLAAIREFNPTVKAIVASGYSSDPVVAHFKDYGFSGRVEKPFDVKHLIRVLAEVLGKDGTAPAP